MRLLEHGRFAADPWRRIADDVPLPLDVPAIVSLARLQAEQPGRQDRKAGLGVALRNDEPVEALAPFLGLLSLVSLEFPKFTDGRAYSQARKLRERLRYDGALRATGQVLADQMLFMQRCGFDCLEIDRPDAELLWRAAQQRFTAFYQPAGDGRAPIASLRRRLAHIGTG